MMPGETEPVVAWAFCCWYCATVDLQIYESDDIHSPQHGAEMSMRRRGWMRKKDKGWICPDHAHAARRQVYDRTTYERGEPRNPEEVAP